MNKVLILSVLASVLAQVAPAGAETLRASQASVSQRFSGDDSAVTPVSDCVLSIEQKDSNYVFRLSSASQGLEFNGQLEATLVPLPASYYKETDLGDNKPYVGTGTAVGVGEGKLTLESRTMKPGAREDKDLEIVTTAALTQITSAKGTLDFNPFRGKEHFTILECKF
ncbi:MAG: hypothetical protein ACXVA9_03430 [Bdellovibrionales bacterium]